MVKVKIIGATGYGGIGLIELLAQHPEAEITALVAREEVGKRISELYPHLEGFCDLPILDAGDPQAAAPADIVVFSTPDRVGMYAAEKVLAEGAKVLDFSGDFRFTTQEAYADYATRHGKDPIHAAPELLGKNAYGLAELHRSEIAEAPVVGNPGCFACSCILGLAPAAKAKIFNPYSVICDCKTGVSGAGKKLAATFHYPARYENMNAYKLAGHQHVCEVERELSLQYGNEVRLTFTAHVLPLCRGIMSTLYAQLEKPYTEAMLLEMYRDYYKDSPFVRVYGSKAAIGTNCVQRTNFCNLVVSVDERVNRLRVVSYIDNLMKGQSGSAVQNINLMSGLPETTGLLRSGLYP
ncbi:MAG: N-acetyl-gamma-glutamyl-phosphate reductase [Kiritimatiellae bacterium]|nr:N-acetyl-gamma-glutamyl-phosphate reductase [Kiritimatiellia bacterium]